MIYYALKIFHMVNCNSTEENNMTSIVVEMFQHASDHVLILN